MHSKVVASTLLGISALGLAAPTGPWGVWSSGSESSGSESGGSESRGSEGSIVTGKIIEKDGIEIFEFPLSNGFPEVNNPSEQLDEIEEIARGTLPNGPPPPPPQEDSLISLGFIAFNELFEVAFFTELIENITRSVPGYESLENSRGSWNSEELIEILTIVQAQEELHELNANGAFEKFTGQKILPCEYTFPVDNLRDAIALASKFTDVVLGTLPDIQTIFANDGDNGLIRGIGSVIGQEGEQNGFYRELLGLQPSALPFLTASERDFALSAIIQNFVVPGSCPNLNLISPPLEIFGVLNVLTDPMQINSEQDVELEFSIDLRTLEFFHGTESWGSGSGSEGSSSSSWGSGSEGPSSPSGPSAPPSRVRRQEASGSAAPASTTTAATDGTTTTSSTDGSTTSSTTDGDTTSSTDGSTSSSTDGSTTSSTDGSSDGSSSSTDGSSSSTDGSSTSSDGSSSSSDGSSGFSDGSSTSSSSSWADSGSWNGDWSSHWNSISTNAFITYVNQQNVPFSEKLEDIQIEGPIITFKALFPGKTNELNGLTIAAVTIGEGPFASVDDVAAATLFGPGLIEVN